MRSLEAERTTTGWAATDPSGVLSSYTYSLRDTGPEDVFIKVVCCGICHSDIHQIKNDLGMSNYPMVPGHEVVGEVVEVGSSMAKFSVGDTVGVGCLVGCCRNCRPCKSDVEQYCNKRIWSYNDVYTDGKPTQGGFAGAMVVDQKFVVKIPEGMAVEQAAPLLCAGITVYSPLNHFGLKESGLRGGISAASPPSTILSLASYILSGHGFAFSVSSRSSANQLYVPKLDRIVLKDKSSIRPYASISTVWKTTVICPRLRLT